MKIKLDIGDENYAAVAKELLSAGFEISDDAQFVLLEKDRYINYISCKDVDLPCHIPTSQVIYIESMGHDITVHADTGKYKCSDTLTQLEKFLNPNEFIRVSKSVIISKQKVTGIRAALSQKFTVTLSNGDRVDVTRSYYYIFKNYFGI